MKQATAILVATIFAAGVSSAQMSREDRDELFQRMDQMCKDADAEVAQYLEFEGNADARGVLKLVGAGLSGRVTLQQFENLEQLLNDFRTNPTICQFEAMKVLVPIFSPATSDPAGRDSGLIDFEGVRLGSDTIADYIGQYDWASANLRQVSLSKPEINLDGQFDELRFAKNYSNLPGRMLFSLYFSSGLLTAVAVQNEDTGASNGSWNCDDYQDFFNSFFVETFVSAPREPQTLLHGSRVLSHKAYGEHPDDDEAQIVRKEEYVETSTSRNAVAAAHVTISKSITKERDYSYYIDTLTREKLFDQYDYSNPISCTSLLWLSLKT